MSMLGTTLRRANTHNSVAIAYCYSEQRSRSTISGRCWTIPIARPLLNRVNQACLPPTSPSPDA